MVLGFLTPSSLQISNIKCKRRLVPLTERSASGTPKNGTICSVRSFTILIVSWSEAGNTKHSHTCFPYWSQAAPLPHLHQQFGMAVEQVSDTEVVCSVVPLQIRWHTLDSFYRSSQCHDRCAPTTNAGLEH